MGAQIHKENVFHKIYWKKFTNNHVNSHSFVFLFLYYEPMEPHLYMQGFLKIFYYVYIGK